VRDGCRRSRRRKRFCELKLGPGGIDRQLRLREVLQRVVQAGPGIISAGHDAQLAARQRRKREQTSQVQRRERPHRILVLLEPGEQITRLLHPTLVQAQVRQPAQHVAPDLAVHTGETRSARR
jgi:hypothetical protein